MVPNMIPPPGAALLRPSTGGDISPRATLEGRSLVEMLNAGHPLPLDANEPSTQI